MSDTIRFDGITIDCPDPLTLARFYAELTGGRAEGHENWAAVVAAPSVLSFQRVEGHRPPQWPDGDIGQQLHLDFFVDDLDAAGARALAAGAVRADAQPNEEHCVVYLDPAGHPFCLTTWSMEDLAS